MRGFASLALATALQFTLCSLCVRAQTQDTPPAGGISDSGAGRTTDLSTFVPHTLEDQKQAFIKFPSEVVHGKHLVPVLAVLGATAGLVAADQYDARWFRQNTYNGTFNSVFSSAGTATGIVLTPAVFYSAGLLSGDDYAKHTGLLTAEAAIDGEIVDFALKLISDRRRPVTIRTSDNYSDSFFEGANHVSGSFPSGHTVAAFAVATVVARRYGHSHRWVPPLAYGLAAAVGFSRITGSAHFPSDVFFGGAVGYSIARFAVLRQ